MERYAILCPWYFPILVPNKKVMFILPIMSKAKSTNFWIDLIRQFVDLFFKSKNPRKRTWHQHVVPYEDRWAVRREGNKRITSKHNLQATAIRKAQRLAKKYKADVIIHREDGTIRDRMSYGEKS